MRLAPYNLEAKQLGSMYSKLTKLKPKLQALRKEGLEAPRIEYDIQQLLDKNKRLHAGWLFDFDYLVLLQKLCRTLDSNFDSYNCPGWGNFGHQLGVSIEVIKVIECSKLGNEGYTYYVLQHYIQKDDATIQKVIQALVNIKRLDVIHQTYLYFNNLADNVLQAQVNQECEPINQQNDEESGYYSVSSNGEEHDENREQNDNQVLRNVEECIIKPNFIPTPALVLRELKEHVCRATPQISTAPQICRIEQEHLQTSAVTKIPKNIQVVQVEHNKLQTLHQEVQEYDCKVMLTFAADGIHFANGVAQALRAKRENGQNFGVLILNEHLQHVESNPELFISGSFPQVDYVVPIITEGYLEAAMDTRSPLYNESPFIDCKYVRFIYSLMNKYYVRNGCLNKKIRCIIPDDLTRLTYKTLMKEPIFEAWVKYSSVDTLAERMFWRCKRKRNCRQQVIKA